MNTSRRPSRGALVAAAAAGVLLGMRPWLLLPLREATDDCRCGEGDATSCRRRFATVFAILELNVAVAVDVPAHLAARQLS